MKFVNEWQFGKVIGLLILAMGLLFLLPSSRVSASEIKIGVVNTEKILRESVLAIKTQKKIEQEFKLRDSQIKALTVQIKQLQQQLEQQVDAQIEESSDRRVKERKLASLSRQHQREQQQMREDLSLRQNEEYGRILDRVNQAIDDLATEQGYDLILQLQDSVYRSARIDITDQIISILNAQEKTLKRRITQ
ncbi:MAG: OmpH family outer membrane protein [Nitrosomonas sp.]|nr:OmpH family outer membrane protein [Nitrosomonas sp.]